MKLMEYICKNNDGSSIEILRTLENCCVDTLLREEFRAAGESTKCAECGNFFKSVSDKVLNDEEVHRIIFTKALSENAARLTLKGLDLVVEGQFIDATQSKSMRSEIIVRDYKDFDEITRVVGNVPGTISILGKVKVIDKKVEKTFKDKVKAAIANLDNAEDIKKAVNALV